MSVFAQNELKRMAENCSQKIAQAVEGATYFNKPFRHMVLDDFLDSKLANACLEYFPALEDPSWEHANDSDIEVKYRTTWQSEFDIPEGIVDAVRILNSAPFLKALADRIGIPKIIPDPYFTGGGLNVMAKGGLLDVHVDGNYHDATGLNRRINAILYLNPNWQVGWGGEFGLYDKNGDVCLKEVAPLFNRLVIFDSHDTSFHGLPAPLTFPSGETRKSIILYYYTKDPRLNEQVVVPEPHSALWKKRGLLDKRGNKTRSFR
jgi:Rps23 Pro-64 3,4-dihydroxylase Tpa1-like proline 4-hydroxylase